jgi:RimJ/RimL family protein N-acetyltransferase
MASKETYWPLFGLRVRTPRLELRYPDDDDVAALAELASKGIHDPDFMPFSIPWTDVESPEQERGSMQHFWEARAAWSPSKWHMPTVVTVDGVVVGNQAVLAENFAATRTATTGSWLGRAYQGQGIGKEMRAAMLHLLFDGLGAEVAESGAWHDNGPSLGVSRALGYEDNGIDRMMRRDVADTHIRLRLTRERWERTRRHDIEIEGLDPCRELFGAV